MDLALDTAPGLSSRITVRRLDGREVPVRLRLLGYDGCEFETDHPFETGDQVSVHIFRMGWIRARIIERSSRLVEAEFDKHSPV